MSVEAPTGGISQAAVSASVSLNGASSAEGPSMPGTSGQISFETLSSMPQMEASLPQSAEFSPKGLDEKINFSEFSIIAQNSKPSSIDQILNTLPFEPSIPAPETKAKVNWEELNVLWQRDATDSPIELDSQSSILTFEEATIDQASEIVAVDEQIDSIIDDAISDHSEEFVATEIAQAKKVQGLLREVGTNEEEAEQIITGILEEKGIKPHPVIEASVEAIGELEPDLKQETAVPLVSESLKDESRVDEPDRLNQQDIEIDQRTHEARKSSVDRIVDELSSDGTPDGGAVASRMNETPDQKSEILFQLDVKLEKDGSFEEAVKRVGGIGEEEPSKMIAKIEGILEENRPVRITQNQNSEKASDEEVKKVLGRAKTEVLNQESA